MDFGREKVIYTADGENHLQDCKLSHVTEVRACCSDSCHAEFRAGGSTFQNAASLDTHTQQENSY
jgi:hypothetical protein